MYNVKEESTDQCLDEVMILGKMQYEEMEARAKLFKYSGHADKIRPAMTMGLFRIISARNQDGVLVGYFINAVTPDILTDEIIAREAAIFVHPDHRGNKLLEKMCYCAEQDAISLGATQQQIAFKVGINDHLLLRYGYKPSEIVYEKLVGDSLCV